MAQRQVINSTIPEFQQPCKKAFEDIVGKGENAGNQHFLLFSKCFLSYERQVSSCDRPTCYFQFSKYGRQPIRQQNFETSRRKYDTPDTKSMSMVLIENTLRSCIPNINELNHSEQFYNKIFKKSSFSFGMNGDVLKRLKKNQTWQNIKNILKCTQHLYVIHIYQTISIMYPEILY